MAQIFRQREVVKKHEITRVIFLVRDISSRYNAPICEIHKYIPNRSGVMAWTRIFDKGRLFRNQNIQSNLSCSRHIISVSCTHSSLASWSDIKVFHLFVRGFVTHGIHIFLHVIQLKCNNIALSDVKTTCICDLVHTCKYVNILNLCKACLNIWLFPKYDEY